MNREGRFPQHAFGLLPVWRMAVECPGRMRKGSILLVASTFRRGRETKAGRKKAFVGKEVSWVSRAEGQQPWDVHGFMPASASAL